MEPVSSIYAFYELDEIDADLSQLGSTIFPPIFFDIENGLFIYSTQNKGAVIVPIQKQRVVGLILTLPGMDLHQIELVHHKLGVIPLPIAYSTGLMLYQKQAVIITYFELETEEEKQVLIDEIVPFFEARNVHTEVFELREYIVLEKYGTINLIIENLTHSYWAIIKDLLSIYTLSTQNSPSSSPSSSSSELLARPSQLWLVTLQKDTNFLELRAVDADTIYLVTMETKGFSRHLRQFLLNFWKEFSSVIAYFSKLRFGNHGYRMKVLLKASKNGKSSAPPVSVLLSVLNEKLKKYSDKITYSIKELHPVI